MSGELNLPPTCLDQGEKFLGNLLEVVAADDGMTRPTTQVTGAVCP